ncbi:thioredoxin family protein [Paenibacillus crassostreae]|uniref:Thiol-disulfide isomerase n=1 Tax=Paenibacillus crassostreae TaxID=1763538 RepID=A0A167DSB9_9BACL|nr:thioredoxin family protein [Paenibacillus crassostreae]AOZ91115.1 thiol reductase thioredoxin [Paenibacillus crassostreae]OAB74725.1 thiol-disulfide isomerase [Paenibacillus crassostreae]
MRELNEQDVRIELDGRGISNAIYLYTPLCGTCNAARRMLEVAEYLLPEDAISAANVNIMPQIAQDFQIRSVPALLLLSSDSKATPSVHYRMGSVEELLSAIRSVIE